MTAATKAAKPTSTSGSGTWGSLLPTYSLALSLGSGLLPPWGLSDSEAGLFDFSSGFLVGMVMDIGEN
jgi:hypothetical protein